MQEVLLQLTAGSAFRPKRPATAPAVREQEGPNAALHDLMESCWHQVRAADTRCGLLRSLAWICHSQPCPLPCAIAIPLP